MANKKDNRGRPKTSDQIYITPEFREQPDLEKLGQALILIAADIARKKKAAAKSNLSDAPASAEDLAATQQKERRAA